MLQLVRADHGVGRRRKPHGDRRPGGGPVKRSKAGGASVLEFRELLERHVHGDFVALSGCQLERAARSSDRVLRHRDKMKFNVVIAGREVRPITLLYFLSVDEELPVNW